MSNPNFDSRYAKTTDVTAAIAAQATTDAGQYQPIINRGAYASRPVSNLVMGQQWVQTDNAGGNVAGTVTRYNGSSWDVIGAGNPQLAAFGMQRNTWISPMQGFGFNTPNDTTSTYQVTGAAGALYGMLFVPRKDISIVSIGAYTSLTSGNICMGILRVDGTTLTRVATTGSIALSSGSTAMPRWPVSSVVLTAGTAYYMVATSDVSGGLYFYGWNNTNRWQSFIGGTLGETPTISASGSFMPLPATIDTTAITLTYPNAYAIMAASSLS